MLALFLAAELPLPAQYPGGIGGIPIPHRRKKTKTKEQQENQDVQNITGVLRRLDEKSLVVEADDTRILSLGRSATTKFSKDGSDIKPDILKPGDHLLIEAVEDDKGFLSAVNVMLQKEGTAEERAQASTPVEISTQASSPDDERPVQRRKDSPSEPEKAAPEAGTAASAPTSNPAPSGASPPKPPANAPEIVPPEAGLDLDHIPASTSSRVPVDSTDSGPPRLQRGKPAPRKSSPAEEHSKPAQVAVNSPRASSPAPDHEVIPLPSEDADIRPRPIAETPPPPDPRIEKARATSAAFTETLPNYVCQEQMARFASVSHKVNWQPMDIVSTEVVYENGHEHYRNIQINGKTVKKKMEELPGAWSTGEFGTVLMDLFSPGTAADFRRRGSARTGGRDAFAYDFDVDHPHSHWNVMAPSQSVQPAYKGSVWIDKETGRVLRIEMEAQHLPEQFPFDKVESSTDYEFIRIGEGQFLLPVHAETLACERGTNNCSHNVIDFRNYHKYSGESTIIFGK